MSNVQHEYYYWMLNLVCQGRYKRNKDRYSELLALLDTIEFEWFDPYDQNRADDGLYLRVEFCSVYGCREVGDGPCSFLEMLVALSRRCDSDIMGNGYEDNASKWFWEMIFNLGLERQSNSEFNEDMVESIVRICINRCYGRNGKGSLFPIKNSPVDLRDQEIWGQMCLYLNDKNEKENKNGAEIFDLYV